MRNLNCLVAILSLVLTAPPTSEAQTFCCRPSLPLGMPNGPASINTPQNPNMNVPNFSTSILEVPGGDRFYHAATQGVILVNIKKPNGTWTYPESKVALHCCAPGVLLAHEVFDQIGYLNPQDQNRYKGVFYLIWQSDAQIQQGIAGRACLSFTNDGINFTDPISLQTSNTVSRCFDDTGPILVEAISGFHRTPNSIQLFLMEGDVLNKVLPAYNTTNTVTLLATTTREAPHVISISGPVAFSDLPLIRHPHNYPYFVNLDAAYDSATGNVYMARAYPYGFDINTTCGSAGRFGVCPGGIATLPNRFEVVTKATAGAVWKVMSESIPWKVFADRGESTGWKSPSFGCAPAPLTHPVQSISDVAMESVNFVHDAAGHLVFTPVGSSRRFEIVYAGVKNKTTLCDTSTIQVPRLNKLYAGRITIP